MWNLKLKTTTWLQCALNLGINFPSFRNSPSHVNHIGCGWIAAFIWQICVTVRNRIVVCDIVICWYFTIASWHYALSSRDLINCSTQLPILIFVFVFHNKSQKTQEGNYLAKISTFNWDLLEGPRGRTIGHIFNHFSAIFLMITRATCVYSILQGCRYMLILVSYI